MAADQSRNGVNRFYSKMAQIYAGEYFAELSPYGKYIDKFLSYLKQRDRILDAGCGAGDSVAYFMGRGFRTEGIDLSPAFINIAKSKIPKGKFEVMDIRKLSYGDSSFDGIYCFATMEHIPKKEASAVLNGFYRVLKKDGILLITTPRGRRVHEAYHPIAKIHFLASMYTVKELDALLRKSGFKVIYHRFLPRYSKSQVVYNRIFVIARKLT
ncbi:MAG: class I SAM-dependent methyltransferase [Candidatus Marsarchaeota archaeon]|nr:class I SAM-dependent methyltransferase [Candidatus Marsarchaeota archaeon]